jgi:hypothetical protein
LYEKGERKRDVERVNTGMDATGSHFARGPESWGVGGALSFRTLRDNRGRVPIGYVLAFVTTAANTTLYTQLE